MAAASRPSPGSAGAALVSVRRLAIALAATFSAMLVALAGAVVAVGDRVGVQSSASGPRGLWAYEPIDAMAAPLAHGTWVRARMRVDADAMLADGFPPGLFGPDGTITVVKRVWVDERLDGPPSVTEAGLSHGARHRDLPGIPGIGMLAYAADGRAPGSGGVWLTTRAPQTVDSRYLGPADPSEIDAYARPLLVVGVDGEPAPPDADIELWLGALMPGKEEA